MPKTLRLFLFVEGIFAKRGRSIGDDSPMDFCLIFEIKVQLFCNTTLHKVLVLATFLLAILLC